MSRSMTPSASPEVIPTVATTTTNNTKRILDDPDTESQSISVKCLKKSESCTHTSDVESENDDADPDIFSEKSKRLLAKMVSSCKGCDGFCICGPCHKKYKPTLKYSSDNGEVDQEVDQENPTLCKRTEDTCENDYDGVAFFPCTVCKRLDDDEKEGCDWSLPYEAWEDIVCDYNCCPGCLASISSEICPVCKTDNDI